MCTIALLRTSVLEQNWKSNVEHFFYSFCALPFIRTTILVFYSDYSMALLSAAALAALLLLLLLLLLQWAAKH